MAKNHDADVVIQYRQIIDILTKTRGFRSYSELDFVRERIRVFDPEYFKDEDAIEAIRARKEKV